MGIELAGRKEMFRDAQISGIVLPAVVLPSTGLGKSGKKQVQYR